MRTKIFIWIVALIGTSLIACTRAAKDNTANITISLPSSSNGSLGTGTAGTLELAHVAINVTGAGMSVPIVYSWDSCRDCQTPPAAPTAFQVPVPSGTGRLLQVLAVYEDTSSQQMTFYYGDVTKDISGASMDVDIAVSQVGQGNITSGRVSGRYFTTSTAGPTGLVDIKYKPTDKPALIVDKGSIVNGWFSMMMLSGANLQYVVRSTGEMLWGQEVSFESVAMDPAENSGAYFDQRVRAFIPVHTAKREQNGVTNYVKGEAETYVWGYWGPGAVGKKVCTSQVEGAVLQRIKKYTDTNLQDAPSFSISHYINWNLAVPTKAQLLDTVSPYGYIVFQGGESMSSSCGSFADSSANQFTNFQKITIDLIDGNGNDSVAGFRGILRGSVNNSYASVSGADPRVITGKILPGVESVFDGVRLFKKVSSEDMHMDQPDCTTLASQGFVSGGADATFDGSGNFSLTSNISSSEAQSGVSGVLCPVKSGTISAIGVFLNKWMFGNSGGSVGGGMATQIALVTPQKTANAGTVGNNVCTPMSIEARNSSGYMASPPPGTNLSIALNTANAAVYQDSSCSGSQVTTVSMFSPAVTVYVKRTIAGSTSANMQISAGALGSSSAMITYADVPSPGSVTPKIRINVPNQISAYECYPISFESWNGSSMMVNFYDLYATYFNLTLPSVSGLTFYYMGDCYSSQSTSVSLGSSPSSGLSFKYTGSATSLNFQPTSISPASPILTSDFVGGSSVTVVQPGVSSKLDMMVPPTFEEGQCTMVTIRSTDSNGFTAPATSAFTVDLSTTLGSGTFYQYGGCSNPTVSSINFSAGMTSQSVYFKATSTGSGNMVASSASPAMSVTRSVQATPATFSQILIAMPGQVFTPGSGLSGPINPIPQGTATGVTIFLVKYDYQLDTNANGPLLTNAYANNGSIPAANSINFSGGQATISLTPDASGNPVSISAQYNMMYGTSASANTYAAATMLNMYMSTASNLAPDGCQIFAVIPESNYGASQVMSTTNYTISADNGGAIYSDASCTVPVSGSQTITPSDRIQAYFFKNSTASTNSTITLTPPGGFTSAPLNATTGSTNMASAYSYVFTGRMTAMKASVCQPYLVSVADNSGRTVAIGADQNVTLQVNSGGGTVGTFDNQSCDWPYDGVPTAITAATKYATVYLTAMIPGSLHILYATGSPLSAFSSSTIIPNP